MNTATLTSWSKRLAMGSILALSLMVGLPVAASFAGGTIHTLGLSGSDASLRIGLSGSDASLFIARYIGSTARATSTHFLSVTIMWMMSASVILGAITGFFSNNLMVGLKVTLGSLFAFIVINAILAVIS